MKTEASCQREQAIQVRNSQAKANELDKELQAVKRQLKRQEGEVGLAETALQLKLQEVRKELDETRQKLHATHTNWKKMADTATNIARTRDEVIAERNLLRQCMPQGHFGHLLSGSSAASSNATELRKIQNTGRLALLGQPDGIELPE